VARRVPKSCSRAVHARSQAKTSQLIQLTTGTHASGYTVQGIDRVDESNVLGEEWAIGGSTRPDGFGLSYALIAHRFHRQYKDHYYTITVRVKTG
jgi:hypothetical protein